MRSNYEKLVEKIQETYLSGTTLEDAERTAAGALAAMIALDETLKVSGLDCRMRKAGVKSLRAAVRGEEIKKYEKKPAEGVLEDAVNLDPIVRDQQAALDAAEEERDSLERKKEIALNAHLYFRSIAKGSFGG